MKELKYTVVKQPDGRFSIMSGKALLVADMESEEAAMLAVHEMNRHTEDKPCAFPMGRW